jgi:hypothetical protein
MGLSPRPSKVLSSIFEDSILTTDTLHDRNLAKVSNRFGTEDPFQSLTLELLKTLRCVPNSLSGCLTILN